MGARTAATSSLLSLRRAFARSEAVPAPPTAGDHAQVCARLVAGPVRAAVRAAAVAEAEEHTRLSEAGRTAQRVRDHLNALAAPRTQRIC
jgi:hypothetical protein